MRRRWTFWGVTPTCGGIYCAGGGMEGAIAALREVRQPGEVALIVNELTPESRAALVSRHVAMAISTPCPGFVPTLCPSPRMRWNGGDRAGCRPAFHAARPLSAGKRLRAGSPGPDHLRPWRDCSRARIANAVPDASLGGGHVRSVASARNRSGPVGPRHRQGCRGRTVMAALRGAVRA